MPATLSLLWQRIEQRLDCDQPQWRDDVDHRGQVSAVEKREGGSRWSDDEVFEGLVRSILSANTKWSKVELVLPELSTLLHGFSMSWYAALSPTDVKRTRVPWFMEQWALHLGFRVTFLDNAVPSLCQGPAASEQFRPDCPQVISARRAPAPGSGQIAILRRLEKSLQGVKPGRKRKSSLN